MGVISQREAERRAKERWHYWRLLLSDIGISYSDLHQMDDEDIAEANAALDLYIKQQNKNKQK
jgi:hypothetical protein